MFLEIYCAILISMEYISELTAEQNLWWANGIEQGNQERWLTYLRHSKITCRTGSTCNACRYINWFRHLWLIQKNNNNKMEQFITILVLMERTFYNVVLQKSVWLNDIMVERVGQPLGRYFGSAKYDLVIMKKNLIFYSRTIRPRKLKLMWNILW